MSFANVLVTEFLKLRRTRIPWVLTLVYCLAPLMMGLMMLVLKNPELGRRLGLVAAKAQLTVGAADWPTYLQLTGFLFAGGIVVMGIVQAFVFGREYAEGTAKNLLTLPVGRAAIVAAKLVVSAAWFLGMAALLCAEAVAVGLWLDLPGFGPALLAEGLRRYALLAGQVLLLGTVPAWIAVAARGYLAPLGFSILLLLIGDLFAHTGWGPWVPWSIPLLYAGMGDPGAPAPGAGSLLVLFCVCAAGFLAAWLQLDRTDNTQ
jgi:ABC-type transport system involved in multi-copper enzyme maturation permease subunit